MDRFKTVEKLGEGSYGSVYKVESRQDGKVYAVKRVPIDTDADLSKLQLEINILRACDSPYVVQYIESFMEDEAIWIVMEHCGAGSASDLLQVLGKPFEEKQIAAICYYMLKGMEYLHGKKKIHRDIKAGNILLNVDGEAKLADFGVSTELSSTISRGKTVIGTPFWMAPEVIQTSSYDGKADIWSLGITAIEMAELRPPHAEKHPMRVIFQIPVQPPPTLQKPDTWSDDFNKFLAKCLVKNPEARPSAADLLKHPFVAGKEQSHKKVLSDLIKKNLEGLDQFRKAQMEMEYGTRGASGSLQILNGQRDSTMYFDTSGSGGPAADKGADAFAHASDTMRSMSVDSDGFGTARRIDTADFETMKRVGEAVQSSGEDAGYLSFVKNLKGKGDESKKKQEQIQKQRAELERQKALEIQAIEEKYRKLFNDLDKQLG